jgi:hypothetical protein
MAKKRRKLEEKKKEREYKPPEFDRLDYIKTEIGISKATMIAAVFSIPMALAAMYIVPVGGVAAGFMAGITGIAFLYILLPMVKIDITPFKITHWAGVMSTYFLVFLTVWVVLCNPPFNDFADPVISDVHVSWDGGYANVSAMGSQEAKIPKNITITNIRIFAQVTDNVKINTATVKITHGNQTFDMNIPISNQNFTEIPGIPYQNGNYFSYDFPYVVTTIESFTIMVSDTNGHSVSYRFDILG